MSKDVVVSAYYKHGHVVLCGRNGTFEARWPDVVWIRHGEEDRLPVEWRKRVGEPVGSYVPVHLPDGRGPRRERIDYFNDTVFVPNDIEMLEGDVDPVHRFLLDHPSIALARDWRLFYFDLETEPIADWSRPWYQRILSVSWKSPYLGKQGHIRLARRHDEAERALLRTLVRLIERHEIALAWNGNKFDFLVLKGRCELLDVDLDYYGTHWLDMLGVFKRYWSRSDDGGAKTSLALNAVASAILGRGKVPIEEKARARGWDGRGLPFLWVWEHAPDLLKEYNDEDVDLMSDVEKKTGFVALHLSLTELCRVFPGSRSLFPSSLVDGRMLQVGRVHGHRFPTRFRDDKVHLKAMGAFVPEAITGLHRSVAVIDYARMYPSIILMGNMSRETLDPSGEIAIPETDEQGEPTGNVVARFKKNPRGILPSALGGVIAKRKEYSDKQKGLEVGSPEWEDAGRLSTACKVLANTFYGSALSPYSRFYAKLVGESVTSFGRLLLANTLKTVRAKGHSFYFGDTDSVAFGASDEEANAIKTHVNTVMAPELVRQANGHQGEIAVDYEKRFRIVLITASKRYAGLFAVHKGKPAPENAPMEVKGLEMVRADSCAAARHLQRAVVGMILAEVPPEAIADHVKKERDKLWNNEVSIKDLTFTRGLTADVDEYKSRPQHVIVAERMLELGLEARAGTRVQFVMTLAGPVHPTELEPDQIDRVEYWNRNVFPPTQRVLEIAFPTARWDRLLFAKNRRAGQRELFNVEKPRAPRCLVIRLPETPASAPGNAGPVAGKLRPVLDEFIGALPVKIEVPVRHGDDRVEILDFDAPHLVANPNEAPTFTRMLKSMGCEWRFDAVI